MTTSFIIPDANIFIKLFVSESDTELAKKFFKTCATKNVHFLVPEHFIYEVLNVALFFNADFDPILELYELHKNTNLTVVSPDKATWLLAKEITQHGHEKSGYPSLYDSIYHALAIQSQGFFVTADKRHLAKTQHYPQGVLLIDYEKIFK